MKYPSKTLFSFLSWLMLLGLLACSGSSVVGGGGGNSPVGGEPLAGLSGVGGGSPAVGGNSANPDGSPGMDSIPGPSVGYVRVTVKMSTASHPEVADTSEMLKKAYLFNSNQLGEATDERTPFPDGNTPYVWAQFNMPNVSNHYSGPDLAGEVVQTDPYGIVGRSLRFASHKGECFIHHQFGACWMNGGKTYVSDLVPVSCPGGSSETPYEITLFLKESPGSACPPSTEPPEYLAE